MEELEVIDMTMSPGAFEYHFPEYWDAFSPREQGEILSRGFNFRLHGFLELVDGLPASLSTPFED